MKQSFKLLSIIILLISCGKIYDLDIPEKEPELVVESFISAQKGVKVYLTSTYPVGTKFKDFSSYGISNARILLYNSNNIKVDSLIESQNGKYSSSSPIVLDITESYRLEISHDNYPTATTAWVDIPKPFKKIDTTYQIFNDTIVVDLSLTHSNEDMSDFSFGFDLGANPLNFKYLPTSNPNIENCQTTRFSYKNLSVYNKDCFIGNVVEFQERTISNGNSDEILYFIGLISPEARIYYRSINNQPSEFEQIVSSPIITKGNIINGEGVFYAIYEYELNIKL
ncbi:DUF4249 domain-containing protein [Portibacter lacus]|uniref:DUF4249 domain-containing protein n=1 Tax=Portibacter lacus TaxID=1099794 RepID=A0AA37WFA0_9BACT|nr:DUF4249 domain-containing protein [Portibacter lacus]GLR19751.1 hypothetical protein GCM10007940_43670 [Portibacter lacus]